jgi:septal ring-binding cell division protein DamX
MMNLDKRQKVILGLILLALMVLIWQIYKLAGGNNTMPQAAPAVTTAATVVKTSSTMPAAASAVRTNAIETAAMLSNAAATAPGVNSASDSMAANQQKYLELVNEYQMSEIQRMIAEDQASIAQSRYNAAEALSKISELSGGTVNLNDLAGANNQTNPNDYELIYTGEDNGQWTATLKKNGQFNDVTAGSVLPDGAKVLTVDDNGVLLQVGTAKMLVTFNGVTPFNTDSNSSSITPPSPQPSQKGLQLLPNKNIAAPASAVTAHVPKVVAQNSAVKANLAPVTVATPSAQSPDSVPLKQPNLAAAKIVASGNSAPITAHTGFMEMNKNDYTIQIVADDQINSVNNFIATNGLQTNATTLKTMRNGKPWYIAVYGDYSSSATASDAIAKLPNHLHSEKPFVRRIGDVQTKVVQ